MTSTQPDDYGLADALEDLRREEACRQTPPHVEAAVLAAWDKAHSTGTASRSRSRWQDVAAIAAAVTLAIGLAQLGQQLQRATERAPEQGRGNTLLLVGEPILQGEPVRMVRMRVPAATLTGLGVRPAAGAPGEHVDVDVIVGEDGVARAIRVSR